MKKRQIEALRDIAIAHFPKARENRAKAVRMRGALFADSGLLSACAIEDPASTAIEKQARELLQLTFLYPAALAVDPHGIDRTDLLANATQAQAEIETAILEAAQVLCELTGDAPPAWIEAAPAAKSGTNQKIWTDEKLLALLVEFLLPGATVAILAKKYGVAHQRISVLLDKARQLRDGQPGPYTVPKKPRTKTPQKYGR